MTIRRQRHAILAMGMILAVGLGGCKGKNVAEVNGEPITREAFVNQLETAHGANTLRRIVLQKLIVEAAQQKGLQPSQEQIEEQMQNFKSNFPSEDVYYRYLKQTGLEETDLRRDIVVSLSLYHLQTEGINPSEDDLRAFFEQNRQGFDQPERVHFHQIVLATKEDADRVYGRLLEGINFEAMATSDSLERASAEQGGEVPVVPVEQVKALQPDLYELLMSLQPGQFSKPTKIHFRNPQNPAQEGDVYAIVRLDELLPAKQVTFDEVRDMARQAYLGQQARPQETVLHELAAQANVLVYSDRYRWLENEFGGQQIPGVGLPSISPEGEVSTDAPTVPPVVSPTVPGVQAPVAPAPGAPGQGPVLPPSAGK